MWYQNAIRRHLCDMHIDDWDPTFLSEFDSETYVQNLKTARIQSAMLYFQSHVGLCYYPTKSGKLHNGFVGREDAMRRLVKRCHEEGIAVTGYYSLIYNTWAHDQFPTWRMVDQNGFSRREHMGEVSDMEFSDNKKLARYGFCCPNNPDYRTFVKEQIVEMAAYFPDVDGMFYDMLFWPHMCYCTHCKARWKKEAEGDIPTVEDWQDPRWLLHMHLRRVWMGEFASWVTDLTKSLLPHVSVEHNVANSALPKPTVANCEEVINACDYAGGDLYRGIYSQSFACKFYRSITKNQPFEYMFSRCAPKLSAHTQIKSPDVMRSALFLTTAHHGATLVIDAIDPVGTMDARVYRQLGEIFGEVIPYEPYLKGEMIEDVGIYYSLKSKFNAYGEEFTNYLGTTNTTETMIEAHVPFGVTGGWHDLSQYKILIASCLTEEDAYDAERLLSYVREGGTLYFSGADCKTLLHEFFHATVTGRTEENVIYIAPKSSAAHLFSHYDERYPLNFDGTAPIVEGMDTADVIATVTLPYTKQDTPKFASIHSNPPGIRTDLPAMAATQYGKGRVIWSALPIECMALYDYKHLLLRLLFDTHGFVPTLTSDADRDVEVVGFWDKKDVYVHTVLLNEAHTSRKICDFSVTLQCASKPKSVLRLPEKTPVEFTVAHDAITFAVHSPKPFETYKIQF